MATHSRIKLVEGSKQVINHRAISLRISVCGQCELAPSVARTWRPTPGSTTAPRGSRGDQSIQHPADRAVVHPGSPYPSLCRGVWEIGTALRPLSQRVTPAAVMLAAASAQEERHRLGRLLSPLRGGPLHPDRRPRDVNCGAGPRRQVTERWEGRNIQSVKDSQL